MLTIKFVLLVSVIMFVHAEVERKTCVVQNDCADAPNNAVFCGKLPKAEYSYCMQCNFTSPLKDCYCPPGQYCISDVLNSNVGFCAPYQSDIIGRSCDFTLSWPDVKGSKNDKLFCGYGIFNTDNTPKQLEWEGACVGSVCHMCSPKYESVCPDGRVCVDGVWTYATSGEWSWSYWKHNAQLISSGHAHQISNTLGCY